MSYDTLVDEVHAVREAYAAQFDYDLHAICCDLREKAEKGGRKLVSPPPKRSPQRVGRDAETRDVLRPLADLVFVTRKVDS